MRRRVPINRRCYGCGTNTSFNGKTQHWYSNKPTELYLCYKCCHNLVFNPISNPIQNKRQLNYKNKAILLSQNPRKYICSWCGKQGKTGMHHFAEYHDDDPLKDTIEVCQSCHMKEHWRLGGMKYNPHRDPKSGRFLSME